LNIHDLEIPKGSGFSCATCDPRQVGYLWAPNWSLTYAILGPLGLFLMLEALKGTRSALNYLFTSDMVRDDNRKPVKEELSSHSWAIGTKARRWFFLTFALIVPALLAYPEWYSHNFLRLMASKCSNCGPSDYDWGLATIINQQGAPNWVANSVFDFLAFTCEALLIGSVVLCFLYLLDVNQVLPGPEGRINNVLWPNLRSTDPRRGFQEFEDPLQLMLNASLVFFIVCYFIRVNRIYMRHVECSSITDFIQHDITSLVSEKVLELKGSELLSVLFYAPSQPKYQEFFGGIALLLISFFSLGVISLTVGKSARRAKANALGYYDLPDSTSLFGLDAEEERKRAQEMTTWPLEWRYFQLDALLAIMGIAVASLYYYRIGLYVMIVVIAALLARLRKAVG
jgi:hypothetical protein